MSRFVARPYEGRSDLHSLIRFAQDLGRASRPAYYHPGDFVWQLSASDRSDDVRLWFADDSSIVACAIFEPPLTFQFAVHPDVTEADAAGDVLRWVEDRRAAAAAKDDIPLAYQGLGNDTLSTFVFDSDVERVALLEANGYLRAQESGVRLARDLGRPLPDIALADGARFCRVSDDDAEARAELHRDAWSVWGESKHSAELYRRLRSAPLYDAELDVVLEYEGRMVSYCVCWLDTANDLGYFEPVGTRPSAAGRGFGRAVIREGMRRLREKGMRRAIVGTAAVNKPAQALYVSAGLEIVEREHFYVKADTRMDRH